MMDEVTKLKTRYARTIEDGRKIEVFTSMPEYQWYIENVINPTIEDYTNKIMRGEIESAKEDWVMRGMVMGIRLVTETPENFRRNSDNAKKQAKMLQDAIEEEE